MYVSVWSGVLGVDGGRMPLPTRPQRYCDPASLVLFVRSNQEQLYVLIALKIRER